MTNLYPQGHLSPLKCHIMNPALNFSFNCQHLMLVSWKALHNDTLIALPSAFGNFEISQPSQSFKKGSHD